MTMTALTPRKIIDIVRLMGSAMAILDAIEPADESEEPEVDADGGEVA